MKILDIIMSILRLKKSHKPNLKIRLIPLKGNTQIIYEGKTPKMLNEIYEFLSSDSIYTWYFGVKEAMLFQDYFSGKPFDWNEFYDEEDLEDFPETKDIKTFKDYLVDEYLIADLTLEKIIKEMNDNGANVSTRFELEEL